MPRFCGATWLTSSPSMPTVPVSGVSRPAMIRSSVDLPDPEGPSSAVSEPSGTSSETSCSAVKSPKCLETELISILIGSLVCGVRERS